MQREAPYTIQGKAIAESQVEDKKRSIPYRPNYTAFTGSVTAAILLQQIFFWWDSEGQRPFYKFNAPCEDDWYKPGDSWQEELGFTEGELVGARDKIAVKITRGVKRKDVLEGTYRPRHLKDTDPTPPPPFVLYWTDAQRRTWYEINPERFYAAVGESYSAKVGLYRNPQKAGCLETGKRANVLSENTPEITPENTSDQTDPQKGLLAPSGAEDVQPIEQEPTIPTAGVLSDETEPEQTLTSKGNGSSRKPSPGYAGAAPDVGSETSQRDAIPYDRKAVFSALVEVCHVEPKAMRGPLNQTVKRLSLAEEPPAPAEVRALYGRDGPWYATDWRGDKRPAPTLAQVVSELVKMREAVRARVKVETSRAQGAGEW